MSTQNLISKINRCINYDDLYSLEKDFNKLGFVLRRTTSNKTLLCCFKDNEVKIDNIFEDFIPLGHIFTSKECIPPKLLDNLREFITENAQENIQYTEKIKGYSNNCAFYGTSLQQLAVKNEMEDKIIEEMNKVLNTKPIDVIENSLD